MLEKSPEAFRELDEITSITDTRDILSHATKQSESYEDYFLVDIDAHVTETQFWPEIIARIDNDVIRQMGEVQPSRRGRHGAAQFGQYGATQHRSRDALSAVAWAHSAPSRAVRTG